MGSQYRRRDYRPFDLVHFTCRGHLRRTIFRDEFDHEEFLQILRELIDGAPAARRPGLLAYGQMPNHQHVFVRCGRDPEGARSIMQSLSTRYAISHNHRYRLKGPVFQKRFRGRIVRGGDHVANTFAYIHLNPDASLRMTNSSHAFYAGLKDDAHIDPTLAWRIFGGPAGYAEFFADTARLRAARAAARWRLGE